MSGCFFCNKSDGLLHAVSTFNVDSKVRRCAYQLSDEILISKLQQLGANLPTHMHTTRLKERILTYIPDLREFRDGRNIVLAFDDDIGNFLSCHLQSNSDDDAITPCKCIENYQKRNTKNGEYHV